MCGNAQNKLANAVQRHKSHARHVVCKKHGKVDEYENCLIHCKYLVEIIILYGVR